MAKDRTTIGQMREQVSIMTVSSNSFGDFSVQNSYVVKYVLHARVRSMDRAEYKRGIGSSTTERTHIVIIRNGSNILIDKDNLIKWDGTYYKILGMERIGRNADDPKKRYVRIEIAYSHEVDALQNPSPVGISTPDLDTIPDTYALDGIPDEEHTPLA